MAKSYDDAREIPKIESWDDIFNRPRYSRDIDGSRDTLKGVLAPFLLSPLQPCGLKNCRTPNGRGYLVVAADDRETNIGANCGKKHFPDFRAEFVRIDRIVRERDIRIRARAAKADAGRIRAQVDFLRKQPHGADWVDRCIRGLKNSLLSIDARLWPTLRRRATNRIADVNEVRYKTKGEGRSEIRVTGKGETRIVRQSAIEETRVGSFTGLMVLTPERDLHELLITRALAIARSLEQCEPDTDGYKPLNKMLQAYGEVDTVLRQAEWAIESGREFFAAQNINLLRYLATDVTMRRKLEALTVEKLLQAA